MYSCLYIKCRYMYRALPLYRNDSRYPFKVNGSSQFPFFLTFFFL
jgi:hypothetical protein